MSDINTVNKLIDQNQSRAQDLFLEAERTLEGVSQIGQFVTTLTTTVTSASQEAQESFEALNTKLTEAEQNLESEVQSAKENLSGLQDKANEVDNQVKEALTQVTSQLSDLKSRTDEMLSEINEEAETTRTNLNNLSQQVQDFETEVDSQLETAKSSSEDFHEFVDTAKSNFNDRKTALIEQFEVFEQGVKERLESVVNDFANLVEEGNNQLETLETALDTASSEVITTIGKKFTEEALGQFSGSAGKLTDAISSLSEVGEYSQEIMDGKLGDIMDKIGDVVAIIQEIKPFMDKVQSVLG